MLTLLVIRALPGIHRCWEVKQPRGEPGPFRGERWIAAFRRITTSRSGDWARRAPPRQMQGRVTMSTGRMTIADRAVLVTGANRGIGQALVEEALKRGAKRVYAGTRQPLAHADKRVTPLTLDVTDAAQIARAVARVESLDVLVNNAGLALYDDLSDRAALERHLTVNLFGTFDFTQAFLPLLPRSRAALVSVLSVTAFGALPLLPR